MAAQDEPPRRALGDRVAHVVRVQGLEHHGADHARVDRGKGEREGQPREDEMTRPGHRPAAAAADAVEVAIAPERQPAELVAEEEPKTEAERCRVERHPDQRERRRALVEQRAGLQRRADPDREGNQQRQDGAAQDDRGGDRSRLQHEVVHRPAIEPGLPQRAVRDDALQEMHVLLGDRTR